MNERIKELSLQAKFIAEEDINRQISYNTELKAFAEKFAELIVKECIDILDDEDDGGADTKSVRLTMIRMKKHFGVEE
jgi:hypothetical protein